MRMPANEKDTPVIFRIGEENRPVVYGLNDFEQSMFCDQLHLFFKHLRRKLEQKNEEDGLIFNDVYDSNIIAFVGERGSGKTSCMYSSIKIVKEAQEKDDWRSVYGDRYRASRKMKFLKVIDPSFFDTKHNILEILVGEMYRDLTKMAEKRPQDLNKDDYRKLLEQFQNTKRHLHFLSSEKSPYMEDDELEELAYLSAGVDLRDSMSGLIDRFLRITGEDVLVIGIDDIDLNTGQAYSMVEQIRKFLVLPQVVILLAVKLDQLGSVVRLELTKQFREVMDVEEGALPGADPSEMAERYLNKLIPLQERIFLPDPSSIFERKLIVLDADGAEFLRYDTVREAVPALIFSKCRYLFYNTKGTTSMIVPRNLRDLRMLIRMLAVMEDYVQDDATGQSLANKQQFKRYFFGSWLDDMGLKYRNVAYSLISEVEPTLFNKKVLDLLDAVCGIRADRILSETMEDIMDTDNMAYNVSVGDVFHILRSLDSMDTSADLRKLIFFIRSLYSIKLYEYYDELTETPLPAEASHVDKPYRGEDLENISDYAKLVAGNLFVLEGDTLLPKENGSLEREIRNIQGGKLLNLISEIVKEYKDVGVENREALLNRPEYIVRLRVAEFFMLTVSRYIWTTENDLKESGIHKFRLQSKAFYDRSFDIGTESLMFDILAPFFTLADIKHSYDRFDNEIFAIVQQCPSSVYHLLHAVVENDGRSFLSRSCLRNAEVLDDLFIRMQKRRGQYRMSDNAVILKNFYKFFANYSIFTYDKWQEADNADQDRYYKITFPEFVVLARLFDDEEFAGLVMEIYNGPEKSAAEMFVERSYPRIWQRNRTMRGKTVVSRIKVAYSALYERIGEKTLLDMFESDRKYGKSSVVKKIANVIEDDIEQEHPVNQQEDGEAAAGLPEAGADENRDVAE